MPSIKLTLHTLKSSKHSKKLNYQINIIRHPSFPESSPQSSSVITELFSCIVSRSLLELASAVVSVELWVLCDDCNSESNSSVGGGTYFPHYLSKFLSEV